MLEKFKNLAIASDHAGFILKEQIIQYLHNKDIKIKDYGAFSEERFDYPDAAHPLATDIQLGKIDGGILICGSGIGVSISANRHKGVRAALCWKKDIAILSRQHNDAQVIVFPARFISFEEAVDMIDSFFNTQFEGGRHLQRVEKIEL